MVLRTIPTPRPTAGQRKALACVTWTAVRLGMEISKGVSIFARERGWALMRFDNASLPSAEILRQNNVQGVVVQAFTESATQQLRELPIPVVNVSNSQFSAKLPKVAPDDWQVGKMAADYFLGRGFAHFAFCGDSLSDCSKIRGREFVRVVEAQGRTAFSLEGRFDLPVAYLAQDNIRSLREWLARLPRPCAVFAWNDNVCDTLLNVCQSEGWSVPDDFSVLGVNNDFNRLMDSEEYSVSSIELAGQAIGYQAAEVLERLIAGQPAPAEPRYVAPLRLVERRSTDFYAVEDPALLAALRFIKRNYQRPVDIEEVAAAAMVSRRVLEKRFRLRLRSSPYEEVLRCRLDRARDLLLNTELKIEEIAQLCGYDNGSNFSLFFSEKTGSSPRAFRQRLVRNNSLASAESALPLEVHSVGAGI
jgi:LacI family transcriptional regulator